MAPVAFLSVTAWPSGCERQVPNEPIYVDKGKLGALRVFTLGPEDRKQIPKLAWDKMRVGMYCMDAHSLGKYESFILKVCQSNVNCVDGVRRAIEVLKSEQPSGGGK